MNHFFFKNIGDISPKSPPLYYRFFCPFFRLDIGRNGGGGGRCFPTTSLIYRFICATSVPSVTTPSPSPSPTSVDLNSKYFLACSFIQKTSHMETQAAVECRFFLFYFCLSHLNHNVHSIFKPSFFSKSLQCALIAFVQCGCINNTTPPQGPPPTRTLCQWANGKI